MEQFSYTFRATVAAVVGLLLKVFDGFLVQQVPSSSNEQSMFAFPAVWSFVRPFETVELELSQERFETRLVEGAFEYFDNRFFVFFVQAPIDMNLE